MCKTNNNFIVSKFKHAFFQPWGWVVRIYHNLTKDETEAWEFLKNTLDLDGRHVDLCNATEIIEKRKLADLFAMTWRWVSINLYASWNCNSIIYNSLTQVTFAGWHGGHANVEGLGQPYNPSWKRCRTWMAGQQQNLPHYEGPPGTLSIYCRM